MENKENGNSKLKLAAAVIVLLMGIILAVGYPTGGVKAPKRKAENVFRVPHLNETPKNSAVKTEAKKETKKKKIIQPVAPPSGDDGSQDEGC